MNIVITGATGGIGKALARAYAQDTSKQIIAMGRKQKIGSSLEKESPNIKFLAADLSTSEGIESGLAGIKEDFPQVDVLIHAAGGMVKNQHFTQDGIELTFAIQFLARLEITSGLIALLSKSPQAKVLSIAGGGAIKEEFNDTLLEKTSKYNPLKSLKNTSVANDMLTSYLSKTHPRIAFYNYGPGLVISPHQKKMPLPMRLMANTVGRLFAISIAQAVTDIQQILGENSEDIFFRRYVKKEAWGDHLANMESIDQLIHYSQQLIEQRKSI